MSSTTIALFEQNSDHASTLRAMLAQFPALTVRCYDTPAALLQDDDHVDVYVLGLDDLGSAETDFLAKLRATQNGMIAGIALCSAKEEQELVRAFEEHDFDSFVSKDWVSPAQMYLAVTAALRSARWRLNHKCAVHGMPNLRCGSTITFPEAAE
ncbi:response regulator [Donghicola eburneus]|uniref:Response regulatory domain-containing protein n=1 Tax=Donghicola eburneus TaxID=393278 RepID=A0A1M4MWZ8_9RHOB|nr:response regulator [Donghicola eburneus]SCM66237.1 hypothetical protein KARMA_0411 [Donghicola eburneus]